VSATNFASYRLLSSYACADSPEATGALVVDGWGKGTADCKKRTGGLAKSIAGIASTDGASVFPFCPILQTNTSKSLLERAELAG
jgi:hypothetical protein